MYAQERPIVFRGIIAATSDECPAHCSAPPLHTDYRLPRLPRDVEAVTRPRAPLRPLKREESSTGAEAGFEISLFDEVVVKVEAEEVAEAPVAAQEEREVRAQFSAMSVTPPAPRAAKRTPGRPKGSKSRPRVEPRHDRSAPPERGEAKKAAARIAAQR